jgi:hypothetical protein
MLTGGACVTHFYRCIASTSVKHRCLSLTSPPACAYRWSMCNSLPPLHCVCTALSTVAISYFLFYIHLQMGNVLLTSTTTLHLHLLSTATCSSLPLLYMPANKVCTAYFSCYTTYAPLRTAIYLLLLWLQALEKKLSFTFTAHFYRELLLSTLTTISWPRALFSLFFSCPRCFVSSNFCTTRNRYSFASAPPLSPSYLYSELLRFSRKFVVVAAEF